MPKYAAACVVTIGLLAGTLLASTANEHSQPRVLAASLETIPSRLDGWASSGTIALARYEIEQLKATDYVVRNYERGSDSLQLLVVYYGSQASGMGPHAPENCLLGDWEIRRVAPVEMTVDGRRHPVNRLSIRNGAGDTSDVLYWYQTSKRIVTDEYARKFFLVWDALLTGDKAAALVRIIVPSGRDLQRAATSFGATVFKEMQWRMGGGRPVNDPALSRAGRTAS